MKILVNRNFKSPLDCYQQDLKKEGFSFDPAQELAVKHIQRLFDQLIKSEKVTPSKDQCFFKKFFQKENQNVAESIKGLYFWGGVGRGKTYIMDTFYNCLPFTDKSRIHFHSFMRGVHQELQTLKNVENPLDTVAERYADKARVICFDEFHVSDITDAMLLGNLFRALFDRNVILFATSNEHPDELYSDGLQRDRFLPAIELIKINTEIVNVDSGIDYRFRVLEKAEIYHSPLDDTAFDSLSESFSRISPEEGINEQSVEIEGRSIKSIKQADSIVWFEFISICDGPRGAADYIEIARIFQTVLVSNVPIMGSDQDDHAKRFMTMIDEFYDRNVKLIISAESKPADLYTGARLAKGFKRTVSRLQEMGTKEYLARQHISD